jgi:hypothetical protein
VEYFSEDMRGNLENVLGMKNVLVKEKSIIYARIPPDGVDVGLKCGVGMQVTGRDRIFRGGGGQLAY